MSFSIKQDFAKNSKPLKWICGASVVWFLLCIGIFILYFQATDPPHRDTAPDPWMIRVLYKVMLFPTQCLLSKNILTPYFDVPVACCIALCLLLVNSFLWVSLIYLLFKLLKTLTPKNP
jgi:membrane-associated HD superfamily phosphohydrolase